MQLAFLFARDLLLLGGAVGMPRLALRKLGLFNVGFESQRSRSVPQNP